MAIKDNKTKRKSSKEAIQKKDPTIRQEFPGAETTKKKIEAGIRNIKNEPPAAPGNQPMDPNNEEPVEEKSDKI